MPPGGREKVMASFERVLMPGSKKISTASCGLSTRTRDGLSEFCHSEHGATERKTPPAVLYRADRPRIDAWQTLVNHHYGCMTRMPRRTAGR